MGFERRKYPRISTRLPVSLIVSGSSQLKGWGTILDISTGGVGLETRLLLKKNQLVYLNFKVAENYDFKNVLAKVVRFIGGYGYYYLGLEFTERVDKKHLVDAVAHYFETGNLDLP